MKLVYNPFTFNFDYVLSDLTELGSIIIGNLSNVTITSVTDNEILSYDSTAEIWINQTAAEIGLLVLGETSTTAYRGDRGALAYGHISADGSSHANVSTNSTHVAGDGSDHADVAVNNAKVTNVTTNLSAGTKTATTIDINSSDGTNATIVEADTTNAGILGSDKWDEIVANTTAKHTQNTDTILGSGAVSADHGTAATDMIVNVCYGTGSEPTASDTTEGTLWVKYTA